jgi:hypothetical protein
MMKLFFILLFLFNTAHAVISSGTVWEIRTAAGAANTNGGGFNSTTAAGTGVDWSQQAAPQYAITTATSAGAGNVLLTASAAADMKGNIARMVSGTNLTTAAPWFEITDVSPGVSITFGTNKAGASVATGVVSNGTFNIGGAYKFGTVATDILFMDASGTMSTYWLKNDGTHTTNGNITMTTTVALPLNPNVIKGYNATRGDLDATRGSASRPTFDVTSGRFLTTTSWQTSHIVFTGTGTSTFLIGAKNKVQDCKIINTSTTDGRDAFSINSGQSDSLVIDNEMVSERGRAFNINTSSAALMAIGNYIHDSDVGIYDSGAAGMVFSNNIIADNVTYAYQIASARTNFSFFYGNTFYGAENKLGTGVDIFTLTTALRFFNNIFYGFVTAINDATDTTQTGNLSDFNAFNNNTNANVGWAGSAGINDITTAPAFGNVTQITGTAATSSTNVLTVGSGTPFGSVTNNVDYVFLVSGTGTGFVARKFLITSHTSTTLTLNHNITSSGAGTSIVWQITLGRIWAPGPNMKGRGFPSSFPGTSTTSYVDIGAAQRREGLPKGRVINR